MAQRAILPRQVISNFTQKNGSESHSSQTSDFKLPRYMHIGSIHKQRERKIDMEKVRIGVIGIGNMGSAHSRTLLSGAVENAELVAVADVRESRREWAKEALPPSVRIFESDEALIASGCCDAVFIVVPHYQHPGITIKALHSTVRYLIP